MTELEFEKACRGTEMAVANEYAWGIITIVADEYLTISGTEDGTETITTDVSPGAYNYGNNTHSGGDGGTGPLRCGIFATSASTRAEAGASSYGIMELSGNLWERPVTLGNTDGRAFTGLNGDGELTTDGNADVTNWPGTGASGSGFRGGKMNNFVILNETECSEESLIISIRARYEILRGVYTEQSECAQNDTFILVPIRQLGDWECVVISIGNGLPSQSSLHYALVNWGLVTRI